MDPLPDLLGTSPGIGAIKQRAARLLQRPGDGRRLRFNKLGTNGESTPMDDSTIFSSERRAP